MMGGGWSKTDNGACSFQGSLDSNGYVVSGMKIVINDTPPILRQ